jgi:hypothetical protein
MKLQAEEIQNNWKIFIGYIETYISSPRKEKLIKFYEKYQERLILMPASHKKEYHNAFPGGYIEHVNRVISCALKQAKLWESEGCDMSTFTIEELVFAAINHDLGKMGDDKYESYIPQTDSWRKDKLGEDYTFNNKIPFASVPDRGLFILQSHGIQYSFNEMIAIQVHDGLYDDGNKKYLNTYLPEQKPRTSLPFIIHQADLMASRIEFEREWLPKFKENTDSQNKNFTLENNNTNNKKSTISTKSKALSSIKSEGLKNILNNL